MILIPSITVSRFATTHICIFKSFTLSLQQYCGEWVQMSLLIFTEASIPVVFNPFSTATHCSNPLLPSSTAMYCTQTFFWWPFHKWFTTSVEPVTFWLKTTCLSYIKKTNIFSITERKSCIKIAPGTLSFLISYAAIHTYCITACIPWFQTKLPSTTVPFFRRSKYGRKIFSLHRSVVLSGVCVPFTL